MKNILFLFSVIVLFSQCKKEKKSYSVVYTASVVGKENTSFTVNYVERGNAYSQTVTIDVGKVSKDWSTTFTSYEGESVLISCGPPLSQPGYTNAASLKITYNGTILGSDYKENPDEAQVSGVLPK